MHALFQKSKIILEIVQELRMKSYTADNVLQLNHMIAAYFDSCSPWDKQSKVRQS